VAIDVNNNRATLYDGEGNVTEIIEPRQVAGVTVTTQFI
jgi:hypothetical protein